MKKVILFLILGVFTLGSSGFTKLEAVDDCVGYANDAMAHEIEQFGELPPAQQFEGWMWYYNACCDLDAGSTLTTVTIKSN